MTSPARSPVTARNASTIPGPGLVPHPLRCRRRTGTQDARARRIGRAWRAPSPRRPWSRRRARSPGPRARRRMCRGRRAVSRRAGRIRRACVRPPTGQVRYRARRLPPRLSRAPGSCSRRTPSAGRIRRWRRRSRRRRAASADRLRRLDPRFPGPRRDRPESRICSARSRREAHPRRSDTKAMRRLSAGTEATEHGSGSSRAGHGAQPRR